MSERSADERVRAGELGAFAALLALTGLAFAQPILSSFGDSPETFIFRGAGTREIVLFALGAVLVPPVALWLLLRAIRRVAPRARDTALLVMVGFLTALFVAGLVGDVADGTRSAARIGVGAVVAGGGVVLYARAAPFRMFLEVLALAPVLFVSSFLFLSPTSELVSGADVEAVEDVLPTRADNLVLIVLDELPTSTLLDGSGNIDASRYPNFAALADDSTWFRNFSAVSAETVKVVPSMLSGQYPTTDAVAYWGAYPDNLFTLLGGSFNLNVHESLTGLCAPTICDREPEPTRSTTAPPGSTSTTVQPEPAEVDEPGVASLWGDAWDLWGEWVGLREPGDALAQFQEGLVGPGGTAPVTLGPSVLDAPFELEPGGGAGADVQPARLVDFAAGFARTPSPALHFLHLVLPHQPYRTLPDGTVYDELRGVDAGIVGPAGWSDPWFATLHRQRLVWQTQYLDSLLGGVIEDLEQAGIYDSSVVAVIADHGAGFQVGEPFRSPLEQNLHQLLFSPFFLKQAHQVEGSIDEVPLSSVDVLPTLADALGVPLPWDIEGSSAFDAQADHVEDRRYFRFEAGAHQPLPDAVFDLDGVTTYRKMLADALPAPSDTPLTDVLYDGTPYRAVIGRSLADLRVDDSREAAAARLFPESLGRGQPLEKRAAFAIGRLDREDLVGRGVVALAIDGVVEAVSPVVWSGGHHPAVGFALPYTSAAAGAGEIGLYLVEGDLSDPGTVTFRRLDLQR